jgi:quercetin dioxygenase-like cupin family protein
MATENVIKTFERHDGKARIFIVRRGDGLFSFRGESEQEEDGETFWAPSNQGGIYGSAEEAEIGAISQVPWLHQQLFGKYFPQSN